MSDFRTLPPMKTSLGAEASPVSAPKSGATRITSIDALRGFVMFTMIFVNALHGAGQVVPDWMVHFDNRHAGGSGMTFVDLVFPAFLFLVGMSIPFAVGSRLAKGEPIWRIAVHVLTRTLSLLMLGILEVNGSPDSQLLGWPGWLWPVWMFACAILAFGSVSPCGDNPIPNTVKRCKTLTTVLRVAGFAGLIYLTFVFRGPNDQRIITLLPFSIHTKWWGILGLIGWAYLIAATVFLIFRAHRTALLSCFALLVCLYPAQKTGLFDHLWFEHYASLGETLGAHASIAVAGLLLASILVSPDLLTHRSRVNFTVLFVAGCFVAARLLAGLYGISKDAATPSWCLWSCAITAALWLGFYYLCDVTPAQAITPFTIAGQNVLLAYLLSEILPSFSALAGQNLAGAIAISVVCALVVLWITARLNRAGFWVRL